MTRRAPHPCLAALYRAGASAARTAAALQRSEASLAFATLSLEDHPLATAPAWSGLVSGPSAEAHVAATLAHLARGEDAPGSETRRRDTQGAPPLPGRDTGARRSPDVGATGSRERSAPFGPTGSPDTGADRLQGRARSAPASADPDRFLPGSTLPSPTDANDSSARVALRSDARQRPDRARGAADAPTPRPPRDDPEAARQAVERAVRQFATGAEPARHAVSPQAGAAAQPPRRTFVVDPGKPAYLSALSDAGSRAATRPVAPSGPAARRAAVERILQGQPVGDLVAGHAAADPDLTDSERRVADALARLGAETSRETPAATRASATPRNGSRRPESAPPAQIAQDEIPAPRNGIERLLVQARRQNLIAEGQSEGAQARLSTEPVQRPDLQASQRPDRALTPAAAPNAESVAQAITDLIRREARAAGIDLKGGRS